VTGFLIVATGAAPYDLVGTLDAPVPGDLCSNALPLPLGMTAGLAIDTFTDDYETGSSYGAAAGPDRAWFVDVPAGQHLNVELAAEAGPLATVAARFALSPDACARNEWIAGDGEPLSYPKPLAWNNTGASTQRVYVVLDTDASGSFPTFSLVASVVAPPAGDLCTNAQTLAEGTSANTGWPNTGATTDQLYLVVTNDGPYNLSYRTVPIPAGDACGAPVSLTAPNSLSASLAGYYADDYGGADIFYRVTVPSGQRLDVTLSASTAADGTVRLYADNPSVCDRSDYWMSQADTQGSTAPVQAQWSNRGDSAQSLIVAVGRQSGPPGGMSGFTLQTALSVVALAPAGDICGTAPVITPGTLTAQSTAGMARDYTWVGFSPNACLSPSFGNAVDRVWGIDVPVGKTLLARAVPAAGAAAVVNLVEGIAASCHDGSTCVDGEVGPVDAKAVNATAVTQRVWIIVTANGTFDLVTALQ
jgi:hypothetical protein